LRLLGLVLHETGRTAEAEARFEGALALARGLDDLELEALVLNNLGNWCSGRGQHAAAQRRYEAAIELTRRYGGSDLEARVLGNMAISSQVQGHLDEAETLYARALELHRSTGVVANQRYILSNMGNLAQLRGRLEQARELHEQALHIQRQRGDIRDEARILGNLAGVELDCGRPEEAETLARQALASHRQTGYRRGTSLVLAILGRAQARLGQVEAARRSFAESLEIRRSLQDVDQLVTLLLDQAELARRTEPVLEACRQALEQAHTALELGQGSLPERGLWLCQQGRLALAEGRSAQAWLAELEALGARTGFVPTAALQRAAGDLRRAQAAFEADGARALFRGELAEELPEGQRRWLAGHGLLSGAQAGLPPEPDAGGIELQLDWD
jgi:tetratricopeptide (TPR) repeat protein